MPEPEALAAPLSFAQERLWFLDQLEPGSTAYNLPLTLELPASTSPAALAVALGEIVRRHQVLRSRFAVVQGVPEQRQDPAGASTAFSLPEIQLTALPDDRRRREALLAASAAARSPFDLAAGPLLRGLLFNFRERGEAGYLLCLLTHHAVFDGSHEPFLRELALFYGAALRGAPSPLAMPPVQYADFARWQRQWLSNERLAPRLDFWRERLAGLPVLDLPTDRPRKPGSRRPGALRPFRLARTLSSAAEQLGRDAGATLYMVLLAGFQTLLWRYTGQTDFALGSPVADRPRPEVEELIGCFTNNLVVRSRPARGLSFRALLGEVRESVLDSYAHREVPFEVLVTELQPERSLTHSPLFQVMLSLLAPGLRSRDLAVLGSLAPLLPLLEVHGGTARFDLLLALWTEAEGLAGALEYRSDLFDAPTAERLLGHFRTLLQGALAQPDLHLAELPLLAPAEAHQVTVEWNDTAELAPLPPLPAIPQLFKAQVGRRRDAVAVVADDRSLSYGELERRAEGLARQLRAAGVGKGSHVAVYLSRSGEIAVALLGILEAGAAYVPLDTSYPEDRVRFILSTLTVRHAVTDERWNAPLRAIAPELREVICLGDRETLQAEAPPAIQTLAGTIAGQAIPQETAGPEEAAYVIFTSGSTGRPKGVLVRHAPAAHLIDWVNRTFAVGPGDRLLFITSLCFDLSVYDVFGPLAAGATVQVATDSEAGDPEALVRLLSREPVTFWDSAPAALQQVVPFLVPMPDSPLRLVFLSGDWIPLALPDPLRRAFPRARVVALGGATEATIWSNSFTVSEVDPEWSSIPYGRPIRNASYRILDGEGNPCPVGVPGDLYIGGSCLAAGYARDPAQTAARFLPDPWAGLPGAEAAGERLYRTGDRSRYRADGEIEFLGRLDQQVKIRGYRVELGEIEATLAEHPEVREAVVLARQDEPGDPGDPGGRRLVAYVVAKSAGAGLPDLRAFLARRLPEYMLPAAIVRLDAMPLNANGKVDRRALPAPDRQRESAEVTAAPRDPTEEALADLWAEAIGLDRVGVHDNLFELGGHSLLATRVVSALRAIFRVDLPLRSLFEAPTVAGQAAAVEALRRQGRELSAPALKPQPRGWDLPLSFAQERLWFMDRLVPESPVYNVHQALQVDGSLDVPALRRSLARMVARHEVLRTTFAISAGRPIQIAGPVPDLILPVLDLSALLAAARETEVRRLASLEARRPFNLGRGPLLRLTVVRLAVARHHLFLTLHHIVGDDWSVGILVRELAQGYLSGPGAPPPAPPLPIQYADFAVWQRQWLVAGGALDELLSYWRERLGGELPVLALPTDRPRPSLQSFRGAVLSFELPAELSAALRELARRHGHTLFMVLLAAYAATLGRRAR
ncbi:MAG TPA: amino acid adenylation domain-containing protein, partial [Thermoanaerobaculia bacterium]|nr:amino acid adenylation domain-containing protein [Thermoanaerobaculia bacterium]